MENFAESKNSTHRCIFNLTKLKFFISTSSFESIQMIDRAGLKNFLTELSPLKMLSDHDTIQLANTYTVSEIQALIAEIDASSELENAFEISESLESHIIQRVIRTSKIKIRELKFHYSVMYDSPEEFTKNANIWIRLLLGQIKKLVQPILDENVGDLGNPFIQYPVLFKNVDSELDKFWSMLEEAHQRWQASSKENAAGLEFFSSKIVELEIQSGDPHHFGRRVLVFHTVDNSKWVYKPRSVASDIFFYDCLQWLTTKSDVTFVIPRFVDKQDYGWMEYISQEPLTVVSQAKRLFHRCGFLNAVLFILKVNDIHEENIRFSGEFPVVIDAETLFHFKAYENFQNSSYELDTTLFSHLFPVSIVDEKFPDSQTVESGINALLGLKHKFEVFSHEYQDEIADGFESALRIFKLYHQDFLLFIKQNAGNCHFRFLIRDTTSYTLIRSNSFQETLCRSFEKREAYLNSLWLALKNIPQIADAISMERRALRRNDIPYFYRTFECKTLFSSDGSNSQNFFKASCLEEIERHFQSLLFYNSNEHKSILSESMKFSTKNIKVAYQSKFRSGEIDDFQERSARKVLDGVLEQAIVQKDSLKWLYLKPTKHGYRLSDLPFDIYDGYSGLLLCFLASSTFFKDERYYSASISIRNSILDMFKQTPNAVRTSFHLGLTGVIFALIQSQLIIPSEKVNELIDSLIDLLDKKLNEDRNLDLISGLSGAIFGLSKIYAIDRRPLISEMIVKAANRLLEFSELENSRRHWKTLNGAGQTGFGHGNSGCAYALFLASKHHPISELNEILSQSNRFEDDYFDSAKENWKDLRFGAHNSAINAWCNGAMGITAARTLINGQHNLSPDGLLPLQKQQSKDCREIRNLSLCHGLCGEIELSNVLHPESHPSKFSKVNLLSRIVHNNSIEHLNNGRTKLNNVGLFEGLIGISYTLIRSLDPKVIPNVLF